MRRNNRPLFITLAAAISSVALVALVILLVLTQLTPHRTATAQTAPAGDGGIIEAAEFVNLFHNGYTTIIASYYLDPAAWCHAQIDDRNCPATFSAGSELRPHTAYIRYGDPLIEYQRLPRVGAGIAAVSFPNTDVGDPQACIVAGPELRDPQPSPTESCVLTTRSTDAPVPAVQDIEFRQWLPGFMSRFEAASGLGAGLLSIQGVSTYALSGAGLFYIKLAIPDFEERYPELRGAEIRPTQQTDLDFTTPDFPLGDDLREDNLELREDISVIVAQLGFEQGDDLELGVLIGTVLGMIIIGGAVAWFLNGWIAMLVASGVYVVGLFIAPSLFTGLAAAMILLSFLVLSWLQRHGPSD